MLIRTCLLTLLAICVAIPASAEIGFVQEQIFNVPGLTGPITYTSFEDIDGDGYPELLATDNSEFVLYSITGDSAVFSGEVMVPGLETKVLLADINRDDIADIAVGQWDPLRVLTDTVAPFGDSSAFLRVYDGSSEYTPYPDEVFRTYTSSWVDLGENPPAGVLEAVDTDNDGHAELMFSYHVLQWEIWVGTRGNTLFYHTYPDVPYDTIPDFITGLDYGTSWDGSMPRIASRYDYWCSQRFGWDDVDDVWHDHYYRASYMGPDRTFTTVKLPFSWVCGWSVLSPCYAIVRPACIGNIDTESTGTEILSRNMGGCIIEGMTPFEDSSWMTSYLELHRFIAPDSVELLWSIDVAGENFRGYVYFDEFPGYFYAFHGDEFKQFNGADGSVNQSTTLIPSGDMHWDQPYDDNRKRLIVVNDTEITWYRLDVVTGVEDAGPDLPTDFALSQNYPNPFNPSTEIKYSIPDRAHVNISVYNVLGQKVATLVDRELPAGTHNASWDSRATSGQEVSSGVYLYRISAGQYSETRRMVLLK